MQAHAEVMQERVDRMRRVCRKQGDDISSPKRVGSAHTLMWDTAHHLVYCPIYKVASGTWTTNFLRLSSFNSDLPKWQRFAKQRGASESTARKMFPPPKGKKKQQQELDRSTKFLVVRHPFDRIVSAYKGKISRTDAKPRFYRKLQKEIKAEYSTNQKAIEEGVPPTFEEYWRYLIDLTTGLVAPRDWRKVDCVQAFYSVCVPCDVEYDLILKLESHEDDTEFLVRRRGLAELQEEFTMWKHKSSGENQLGDYDYYVYDDPRRNPLPELSLQLGGVRSTTEKGEEEEDMVPEDKEDKAQYKKSLFGQLSKVQVRKLYRNYKTDFDMFGYNITEFLIYAKANEETNETIGSKTDYEVHKTEEDEERSTEDEDREEEDEEEEDEEEYDEDEKVANKKNKNKKEMKRKKAIRNSHSDNS